MSRRGPAELLRTLPRVLGRRPITGETVLLGWNDENRTHAVAIALHPDCYPFEQTEAVHQIAADGASRFCAVAYTGPGAGAELDRTLHWLVASAVRYGLDPLDALIVTRHRDPAPATWRSLDCTDPSCCPPEGNTLIEEPTP